MKLYVLALAAVLSVGLAACASGGPSAAPAGPPAAVTPAPESGATGAEAAGPGFAAPLGVDLDTVQVGRFEFGKMWTFEFPPVQYFGQEYGFDPDSAWFTRARLGALRIPGCSASFVSADGLVMTNHHCAREHITAVTGEGENLIEDGFYARSLAEERAIEGFQADQLMDILDVTDEVESLLEGLDDEERSEAEEEVFEDIRERIVEERGGEDVEIDVEVISLFAGGHYSAYVFRRYTNVKLVMAPELQIGFYGGDPDNFTYPRYNLDFAFLRVYNDEGDPLDSAGHYFELDDDGLAEGDPVFVIGNPGSTSRLQTVAELEFRRDVGDRGVLTFIENRIDVLRAFQGANPEVARRMDLINDIFSLQNSQKAYTGQLAGLADPVILTKRLLAQRELQDSLSSPARANEYGSLIERMAELQERKREHAPAYASFLSLTNEEYEASTFVRALIGLQVMNVARANPSAAAGLRTQFRNVDDKPEELEVALMAARLQEFADHYGVNTGWVQDILRGRTPEEAARAIYARSVLADSATAVAAVEGMSLRADDPAMLVVRGYLPAFQVFQQMLASVFPEEERIARQLGRVRMEIYGTDRLPPDATFSLRIADGVVAGYPYNGTLAPPFTTFHGLYDRHYSFGSRYPDPSESPWALPDRWMPPPAGLDLTGEVNFVFTADIIGGNSGSPVIDQEHEVVGLVFDGNMESLPGDYIYLPDLNRAVAVDVRGIVEALESVYEMDALVQELRTGTTP
ncbi:MAG: S46 family peptidase [Gemmatimonadota bacterium]|nr:S46 family peptidase [Gemmatimonadota bacterium]